MGLFDKKLSDIGQNAFDRARQVTESLKSGVSMDVSAAREKPANRDDSEVLVQAFCATCGALLSTGAKFCASCGAPADSLDFRANVPSGNDPLVCQSADGSQSTVLTPKWASGKCSYCGAVIPADEAVCAVCGSPAE